MVSVFNVLIEFNPEQYERTVNRMVAEHQVGYCCCVDGNVITIAQKDEEYRNVLNNALLNTCDGSSIAAFASKIHRKDFRTFNGPEIFRMYFERPYKQVLVGNTDERAVKLVELHEQRGFADVITHIQLPFCEVDGFDYEAIAKQLNELKADLIWVSLGAPKQEKFMARLCPLLDRGIMFGIGAAVNFYTDNIKIPKRTLFGLRFIWLKRLFVEPRKQFRRCWSYVRLLPQMIKEERKQVRHDKSIKI